MISTEDPDLMAGHLTGVTDAGASNKRPSPGTGLPIVALGCKLGCLSYHASIKRATRSPWLSPQTTSKQYPLCSLDSDKLRQKNPIKFIVISFSSVCDVTLILFKPLTAEVKRGVPCSNYSLVIMTTELHCHYRFLCYSATYLALPLVAPKYP
jgi:hypothetical protein